MSLIRGRLQIDVELRRLLAGGKLLRSLPRLHVTPELRSLELGACVQHEHAHALACQIPGRHSARRAAADDDYVVNFRTLVGLH
jgi:hypothetical protein